MCLWDGDTFVEVFFECSLFTVGEPVPVSNPDKT